MSLPWLRSKLLRQVYEIRLQSSSHMLSVLWFNEEFIILLYLSTICSPTTKLHYHKVISSYYYFEFIFILLFEERKHTVHAQWKMVKNVFSTPVLFLRIWKSNMLLSNMLNMIWHWFTLIMIWSLFSEFTMIHIKQCLQKHTQNNLSIWNWMIFHIIFIKKNIVK